MVTLRVGPQCTAIKAHKALLGFHSKFFEAAFFGGFKEAKTNEMDLPEDKEDDIRAFVLWTYTGDVISGHRSLRKCGIQGSKLRKYVVDALIHEVFSYEAYSGPELGEIVSKGGDLARDLFNSSACLPAEEFEAREPGVKKPYATEERAEYFQQVDTVRASTWLRVKAGLSV